MTGGPPTILIVTDNPRLRREIRPGLADPHERLDAAGREEALGLLEGRDVDVVLVDLNLPSDNGSADEGLRTVAAVRTASPRSVILVTGADGHRSPWLRAAEAGAYDFFTHPVDASELCIVVRRAMERRRMDGEVRRLKALLQERSAGSSPLIPAIPEEGFLWEQQVESFERGLLEEALRLSKGKKIEAAQRLGLKKDQMKYLCRKYRL